MRVAILAVTLALASSMLPVSAQALTQRYDFVITRQPLNAALQAFADQTGLQVAVMSDAVDGKVMVGPVNGTLSAEEALTSLLAPKGLSFKEVNERTIAVFKQGSDESQSSSSASGRAVPVRAPVHGGSRFRVADANSVTTGATAASAMSDGESPQEVVITGLSERHEAQKAPVAVSVFTEAAITDARINDVESLVKIAPNLSFSKSQGAAITLLTIRGITQVLNGQSPVAVVVDGVQQMHPQQFSQDLHNVSQIEVLRGPQGDLWGRNAIGGAIIINTDQPTNEFRSSAGVTIGSSETYKGRLAVSGPIVRDRLFYGISASADHFGGLLENVHLNRPVDFSRSYSARGHIRAVLTDRLTADLRASAEDLTGGANTFHYQPANYDPERPCFLHPTQPFTDFTGDADLVDRTYCANNLGREDRQIREASLKLSYEGSLATVTNVAAWSRVTDALNGDQFPYTASTNVAGLDNIQTTWQRPTSWQNEFRITSHSDQRLRWMIGAYYLNVRTYLSRAIGLDKGLGMVQITDNPDFDNPINPTISYLGEVGRNYDHALFGHVAYDVTPDLTAELGFRYDWNELNQYVDPRSTSGVPAGCVEIYSDACHRTVTFPQGQPKATLTYRLRPNITLFTNYGVGYRSGQFNQSGTAIIAGLPGVRDIALAERANTFELGFKSQLLDGALTLNASFFDTKNENPAYLVFIGSVGAQVLVNVDEVRLTGFDFDFDYAPLTGLNVFAGGGYTHSSIKEYTVDPAVRGNWAVQVPEFNVNAGIQYRRPISAGLFAFGRFDVQMMGKEYWDVDNSTARDPFNICNLQLGVEEPGGKWSLILFARNLTDTVYNDNYVLGGFTVPGQPRTYGVDLRYRFR